MESELAERHFVFIPGRSFEILDELEADVDKCDISGAVAWKRIWREIPRAETDSREALYCYAVGRNTACGLISAPRKAWTP